MQYATPLLLDPRAIGELHSAMIRARTDNAGREKYLAAGSKVTRRQSSKVGVLSLHGLIEQHQSFYGWLMGGVDTTAFAADFDAMLNDPSVGALVIDINSPGGTVAGTSELADRIYAGRQRKPVYAVANSLAASAAFWIGSAASKLYASPGSEVGSVGVITSHMDASGAYAKEGLKPTIITSTGAPYKAEWSDAAPLSPDALAYEQKLIDAIHADFVNALARNRGVSASHVSQNFGKGRTLRARDALAAGMVDGIATLDEVLRRAVSLVTSGSGVIRSAEEVAARERHAVRTAEGGDRQLRERLTTKGILGPKAMRPGILRKVSGYCVLFNVLGWHGNHWEIVSPNAFDHILDGSAEVTFTRNHGYHSILARRSQFGVHLTKDDKGIFATVDIPDDEQGRYLLRGIQNGEATGWSFSTTDANDQFRFVMAEGRQARLLERGDLNEICVLLSPSQPTYKAANSVAVGVC